MARGYQGTSKEDIAFGKMDKFMDRRGKKVHKEPSLAERIKVQDEENKKRQEAKIIARAKKKEDEEEIRFAPGSLASYESEVDPDNIHPRNSLTGLM